MFKNITSVIMTSAILAGCGKSAPEVQPQTAENVILENIQEESNDGITLDGTLLKPLIGAISTEITEDDLKHIQQAEKMAYTAGINQIISWNNPTSNYSGSIMPTREGTSSIGAYCREFAIQISNIQMTKEEYSIACQQPDGTWRIQ